LLQPQHTLIGGVLCAVDSSDLRVHTGSSQQGVDEKETGDCANHHKPARTPLHLRPDLCRFSRPALNISARGKNSN
jgi:hypothetical protein